MHRLLALQYEMYFAVSSLAIEEIGQAKEAAVKIQPRARLIQRTFSPRWGREKRCWNFEKINTCSSNAKSPTLPFWLITLLGDHGAAPYQIASVQSSAVRRHANICQIGVVSNENGTVF